MRMDRAALHLHFPSVHKQTEHPALLRRLHSALAAATAQRQPQVAPPPSHSVLGTQVERFNHSYLAEPTMRARLRLQLLLRVSPPSISLPLVHPARSQVPPRVLRPEWVHQVDLSSLWVQAIRPLAQTRLEDQSSLCDALDDGSTGVVARVQNISNTHDPLSYYFKGVGQVCVV